MTLPQPVAELTQSIEQLQQTHKKEHFHVSLEQLQTIRRAALLHLTCPKPQWRCPQAMTNEVMYSGMGKSHQPHLNPHHTPSYNHIDGCSNLGRKVQGVLMWMWLLHLSLSNSTPRMTLMTRSHQLIYIHPITPTLILLCWCNNGHGRGA